MTRTHLNAWNIKIILGSFLRSISQYRLVRHRSRHPKELTVVYHWNLLALSSTIYVSLHLTVQLCPRGRYLSKRWNKVTDSSCTELLSIEPSGIPQDWKFVGYEIEVTCMWTRSVTRELANWSVTPGLTCTLRQNLKISLPQIMPPICQCWQCLWRPFWLFIYIAKRTNDDG